MRTIATTMLLCWTLHTTATAQPASQPAPAAQQAEATERPPHPNVAPPAANQANQAPPPVKPTPLVIRVGDPLELIPSLQIRPRVLYHGGRDFTSGNNYEAVSHRARLGVQARLLGWMSTALQIQDVRIWGEELNTLGDFSADGFDVHQAWVELGSNRDLSLRLGRQEINIDNQRLIGAVGWSDQGRALDAALIDFKREGLIAVRGMYAKLGEKDALVTTTNAAGDEVVQRGAREDTDLAALSVRLTRLSPWVRPSLTAIYDHIGVDEQHRVTFGAFVDGEPLPGLTYQLEGYLQLGQREPAGGTSQDIQAFLGAVHLGYEARAVTLSPQIEVWFELLSGDDDPADDTVKSFDTLLATNHKFYGFMDFFLNIPLHTGGRGLMDLGGRLKVKPLKQLLAMLDFHNFRLAREDAAGATSLGSELDLVLRFSVNRYLSFEAVAAVFFPAEAMTALKGGDDPEPFGYLQTNIQF